MRRQARTRSKFGNIHEVVDGITFMSKAEARRYRELRLLERAGKITKLSVQPSYVLLDPFTDNDGKKHRAIKYVGDFFYYEGGMPVVEDVKTRPTTTAVFKLKEKLFRAQYDGIKFLVVPA